MKSRFVAPGGPRYRHPDIRPEAPGSCKEIGMTATQTTQDVTQANEPSALRPFHVEFPQAALDDLKQRISSTQWPERELVADASQGVQLATMQQLADYWVAKH